MTVRDEDREKLCMGYAAFIKKWNKDEEFRQWFRTIEASMKELVGQEQCFENPKLRLQSLQHFLCELLQRLDSTEVQWDKKSMKRCKIEQVMKEHCRCKACQATCIAANEHEAKIEEV